MASICPAMEPISVPELPLPGGDEAVGQKGGPLLATGAWGFQEPLPTTVRKVIGQLLCASLNLGSWGIQV